MKIGIDATPLCYPRPTGIGRYILNLVRNLREIAPDSAYRLFASWPKVRKKDCVYPAEDMRYFVPSLAPLFIKGVDIFHQPAFKYVPAGRAHFLVTFFDAVVALPDDFTSKHSKEYNFPRYQKGALKAERIITSSSFSRDEISLHYGVSPEKIRMVPLGVEEKYFSAAGDPGFTASAGLRNYFLFVGNIERRKNIMGLIKAFEKVLKKHAGWQLVLAGQNGWGGEEADFYLSEKKDLTGRIIRYQYADEQTLMQLYGNASAFVFPSFYEGFGLPLLEAMAAGLPVLASDILSSREIDPGNPIYFDPRSIEDMSGAMLNLIENIDSPKVREAALRGRERAMKYTWRKTAEETLKIYKELLN